MISSPASSGSSLSTKTRLASPPPNRCVKSMPKLRFTCSNAVNKRSRPSLLRLAIPLRSVLIASSKIGLFVDQCVMLFLRPLGVLFGAQVHRAQRITLPFQARSPPPRSPRRRHLSRVDIQVSSNCAGRVLLLQIALRRQTTSPCRVSARLSAPALRGLPRPALCITLCLNASRKSVSASAKLSAAHSGAFPLPSIASLSSARLAAISSGAQWPLAVLLQTLACARASSGVRFGGFQTVLANH